VKPRPEMTRGAKDDAGGGWPHVRVQCMIRLLGGDIAGPFRHEQAGGLLPPGPPGGRLGSVRRGPLSKCDEFFRMVWQNARGDMRRLPQSDALHAPRGENIAERPNPL